MDNKTRSLAAALLVGGAAALLPSPARACGGSIALQASDFGPGATVISTSEDETPQDVNDHNAAGLVGFYEDPRACQRYARLGLEGQFSEQVDIRWPWATGAYAQMSWGYHHVQYSLATFPSPRAAQAAYRGDVAFLRTRCRVQQAGEQVGCAARWVGAHVSSTYTGVRLYKNMVLSAAAEDEGSGPGVTYQLKHDVRLALVGGYVKLIVLDAECAE